MGTVKTNTMRYQENMYREELSSEEESLLTFAQRMPRLIYEKLHC